MEQADGEQVTVMQMKGTKRNPIIRNDMQHRLMSSSYGSNEDVMGNAPSNLVCTWLCDSSQLCQCDRYHRPTRYAD